MLAGRYRTLLFLLVLLTGSLFYGVSVQTYWANDGATNRQLNDRVNPNSASWASLARLPGIGRTKAQAIVNYRDHYRKQHGMTALAFTGLSDLDGVKGIGPVTLSRIEGLVSFNNP